MAAQRQARQTRSPWPRRVLCALALLDAALVWTLWQQRAADDAARAARPAVAHAPAPAEVAPAAQRRPVRRAAASASRPSAARVAAAASAAGGDVEICGYGSVHLPPDVPYGLERVPGALRSAALDAAEARLLAGSDEAVRAAALMIGAQAKGEAARERIDRLVRLADASRDAAVYAIAREACRGYAADEGGACRLLSAAQGARLDADNALPWLELAGAAPPGSEAQADAMHRASQARHAEAHAALLPGLVERGLDAAPALQRTLVLAASWSAQAAWAPSHSNQAYLWCTAEALADANRRQTCEALAETLVERSDGLAEVAVGIAIGRNLGWPAERLQAAQAEHDALAEAGRFPAVGIDLSCRGIERVQGWMRRLAALGEVGAARAALAEAGASVAQWSERYRKELALATSAAEAAARAEAAAH